MVTRGDFSRTGYQDARNAFEIDEFRDSIREGGTPGEIVRRVTDEWDAEDWIESQDADVFGNIDPYDAYSAWKAAWEEVAEEYVKRHIEDELERKEFFWLADMGQNAKAIERFESLDEALETLADQDRAKIILSYGPKNPINDKGRQTGVTIASVWGGKISFSEAIYVSPKEQRALQARHERAKARGFRKNPDNANAFERIDAILSDPKGGVTAIEIAQDVMLEHQLTLSKVGEWLAKHHATNHQLKHDIEILKEGSWRSVGMFPAKYGPHDDFDGVTWVIFSTSTGEKFIAKFYFWYEGGTWAADGAWPSQQRHASLPEAKRAAATFAWDAMRTMRQGPSRGWSAEEVRELVFATSSQALIPHEIKNPARDQGVPTKAPRVFRPQRIVAEVKRGDPRPEMPGSVLYGPESVIENISDYMADRATETFLTLFINVRNKVIGYTEALSGSVASVEVDVAGIFREALLVGAAAIVTVHNHPSGDPAPSDADRALWRRVRENGSLIGIPVMDNMVIGENSFFSEEMDTIQPYKRAR